MNIKTIILGLLGGPVLVESAKTDITPGEQNRIEDKFNQARSEIRVPASNMRYVKYNPQVQKALESYVKQAGALSFNIYPYGWGVMQDSRMPEEYRNWTYLFHDTSGNDASAVSGICHFRAVKQKRCYNQPSCSKVEYTGFSSCYNTAVPAKTNCNWFFKYYPKMVLAGLKEISCVRLGIPGRVNLHKQPNSFWCYGLEVDSKGNALIEYPDHDLSYKEGEPCSDCPEDQPFCRDKALCVAYDMTRKPTTLKPTKPGVTLSPTTEAPATKRPTKRKKLRVA